MIKLFYPYEYVESVFVIDYDKLYQMGYRGIIFDIDNTLVHHGDDSTREIDELFKVIHQKGFKTLLLSNNSDERINRFNKNINTQFISNADKPKTKNYLKAIEMMNIKKEEVVFVGDQIFTDILGANLSGMANVLAAS
jgi:HAD superfamily phosphatase (TIGR01668 family)